MAIASTTAPTAPLLRRAQRAVGLTSAGVVVVVGSVVCWLLARLQGGRTLFLLVYGAVVVVLIARFMGRKRLDLEARRTSLPPRLRQGQQIDVDLALTATRRVGVFVMEEHLHPHLGRERRLPVAGLASGAEVEHRYTITPRLRGVYSVGPLNAVWTDPFGLTRRTTELLPASEVVVHPSTEPVHDRPLTRQWEDPPVRPPESKPWPSGFEFYGMRDYVRGDDLRRVVWKAVARTGRVLIRESEQGITDKVLIHLDTDVNQHSPGEPSDTFEAAVRTVASLAVHHLKDGFSVLLATNDAMVGPARRGEPGRIPLLDDLARVQRTATPLGEGVDTLVRSARSDLHTIVVTPHLDDRAAARLKLVIDRGTRVVLVVLTWEETDPRTIAFASSLGCQVVQLRPLDSLEAVFRAEIGAGR
ncbi:MAG: hypothetical protein QOD70_202 [Frankiales bacterium]|nr:hypothetical protein [Frankiales bacterium]